MKHTECEDCKLRNGDCGHHFKGLGYTNYGIPSSSACDRYGNCEFFQQEEIPQGDLISREALRDIVTKISKTYTEMSANQLGYEILNAINNAPAVLFPLTVKIKDNVTDEDIEVLKRLMEDYKPQVLNLETERPQGEWTNKHFEHADCSLCGSTNDYHGDFCKYCGADMRKGGAE